MIGCEIDPRTHVSDKPGFVLQVFAAVHHNALYSVTD